MSIQQLPGTSRRIAVVGGGISGLAAAWRLTSGPDAPAVTVLEAASTVGGKLQLAEVGGLVVDVGAEAMLARRPEGVGLIREAGLGADLVHPATTAAGVVRDGRILPLPPGTVMGIPTDPARLSGVLTPEEIAEVAAEPDRPAPPLESDVDVASWVTGRVGRAVVERLVEPLLGGVYAGHASRLSLQATVPQLWELARQGGSVLAGLARFAPPPPPPPGPGEAPKPPAPFFAGIGGGVGRLPLALADRLAARGAQVRTGVTVRELHRTPGGWRLVTGRADRPEVLEVDAVVLALPPAPAARLLAQACPDAAAVLAEVETAGMAVVAMAVPRSQLDGVAGSGVLIPPVEGRPVKAATFSSAKWGWVNDLDPDLVLVRASLGRLGEEAVLQRDDGDLVATSVAELSDLLGRRLAPVASYVARWAGALPQYAVGHVDRVARIRAAVAGVPGLAVCGATYDGVGIAACIASADRAAEQVLAGGTGQVLAGGTMPV
ncbi:MAG TPA: protoporphyrinogen oxidase [Kineosporiaceae bacterium]|nr:protoporphyrinogen oxidase [Kineosporiaceae bacterium]